MTQPITAKQLGNQTGLTPDQAGYLLVKLAKKGLLTCLNPKSRRSRLYWLSNQGQSHQQRLLGDNKKIDHDISDIDWNTFGDICFSHRSIVVRTLREPMQPATIKRQALRNNPTIRFSSNNCRDAIRFLKRKNVVRPVVVRRKKHFRYELTPQGRHMQRLLWQAEVKRF